MAPLVIQFCDISTYCERSIRRIEKGSFLASSPHLMKVACTFRDDQCLLYTATCIQTSNTNGPYTVDLKVELIAPSTQDSEQQQQKRIDGSCTCKANTNKCKHIVALLLKLMNKDPGLMDVLSQDDSTNPSKERNAEDKNQSTNDEVSFVKMLADRHKRKEYLISVVVMYIGVHILLFLALYFLDKKKFDEVVETLTSLFSDF